jgi:(4S)-4-hydroxy-5-phosphonooxypentane-2,3-dione isomerase
MLVALIYVHVKPESIEAFKEITLDNARNSVLEPGVARFDMIQQADDPTRFVLIEAYRDDDGPARHRETAHYARWRDGAPDMMQEPRTGVRYTNIFPEDSGW